MASSGLTVRNISQVALGSDQSLSNSTTLTTFFSPTYTNLFSGSKVLGALTAIINTNAEGTHNGRKVFNMAFTGSNITDITLQRNSAEQCFGSYDYGGGGVETWFTTTIFGPLLTTNAVAQITCNCKMANAVQNSNVGWTFFGNNTTGETHFTWIEYK